MATENTFASGFIFSDVSKLELAAIFNSAGYQANVGQWSVRLDSPMKFKIAYVGNLTPEEPYEIEGDGYGVDLSEAVSSCVRLAEVLTAAGIRFEFCHLKPDGEEIAVYENTSQGA